MMKQTNSIIYLKEIRCYAYHGVLPQEKRLGNEYTIELKLKVDISKAMQTDEVTDTVNYAEVYEVVKQEMAIPSKLLEHVCGRIADHLFQAFPTLEEVEIDLAKRNPPMSADIRSAGVILRCSRE
jgi:dihydroneopterin aldolase